MFRLALPDPVYASKTAWRFLALVYSLALFVFIAGATARWWARTSELSLLFFMTALCLIVPVVCCFALAAVGWAAFGFRGRAPLERRAAWRALAASAFTLALLASYLAFLAGVIRVPNI
jgi:ABC-type amino acid transport system permease subunit